MLLERGRPTSYVWYPLAVAPGTKIHALWSEREGVNLDYFLDADFVATPFLSPNAGERAALRRALGEAGGFHVLRPDDATFTLETSNLGQPALAGPVDLALVNHML